VESTIEEWQHRIAAARATQQPLRLRGAGSKDFYGEPPSDGHAALDTRAWRGIVDYQPSELFITARCGTPLAEIESALAEHGQMLAFEPPYFGSDATLGGCIATGLSGPRRMRAGAARDFMLGARLLDGHARVRTFGGQVMKNVAGFDVSRLLAGSLGTLGILLEVSLKTLPRPVQELSLRLEMDEAGAMVACNRWVAQALPISASCWHAGTLHLRLSGAPTAIRSAQLSIGGETMDGDAFWRDLREQRHGFFGGAGDVWRLALPALTPPSQLPATGLVEWLGAQRWMRDIDDADALRSRVVSLGGHATLFRSGRRSATPRFQALSPQLLALHRRLKTAFDPDGVFNPGRMYSAF